MLLIGLACCIDCARSLVASNYERRTFHWMTWRLSRVLSALTSPLSTGNVFMLSRADNSSRSIEPFSF